MEIDVNCDTAHVRLYLVEIFFPYNCIFTEKHANLNGDAEDG
jgi:hypothetical protein